MPIIAPQVSFPTTYRRSVRRRQTNALMGSFGLVPTMGIAIDQFTTWRGYRPTIGRRTVTPMQPIRSTATLPAAPTSTGTPPVAANTGTPVPAGFATNQIFVAPDGSQWIYSASQSRWISMGTPFNVGVTPTVPVTPGPSVSTAPTTPVSVSVTPTTTTAPAASPYQSILDFATASSMIPGAPNWAVGLVAFLAFKLIEGKISKGGRRNPSRRRRRR
jgi:hypothetical protein